MSHLLRSVLPDTGLLEAAGELNEAANRLAGKGVTERLRGIGEAIFIAINGYPSAAGAFESIASHRSDMVRAWAAFALTADRGLSIAERLKKARRFAKDGSVAVRECAWDSFRPYVAADLSLGLGLLESWVRDPDPSVRRCAVEATRPRGVWCSHIDSLKRDPEPGLILLEPVRSDPSPYVQRSAGNWLNDASKTRPDWVRAVCARWAVESPTKETAWITKHAQRTLRKVEVR